LLDVHGALDALPTLPLDAKPGTGRESLRATGTDDHQEFAPKFAPNTDKRVQTGAIPDNRIDERCGSLEVIRTDANLEIPGKTGVFSRVERGETKWAMRDSNPRHPACKATQCRPHRQTKPQSGSHLTENISHLQGSMRLHKN